MHRFMIFVLLIWQKYKKNREVMRNNTKKARFYDKIRLLKRKSFINSTYYVFPFLRRVSCNNCKNRNAKNKK